MASSVITNCMALMQLQYFQISRIYETEDLQRDLQRIGIRHSENNNVTQLKLSWNEVQAAVPLIVYCTPALTSLSDCVSYVTFLIFGMAYCVVNLDGEGIKSIVVLPE